MAETIRVLIHQSFIVLAAVIAGGIQCLGQTCNPPARAENSITIDGTTGQVREGKTIFKKGNEVQVIVENPNPFRYRVRTDIKVTSPDPKIVEGFLGKLGISISEIPSGMGLESRNADNPGCATKKAEFESRARDLRKELTDLRNEIAKSVQEHDDFVAYISAERLECETAIRKATDILPILRLLIDPSSYGDRLIDLQNKIKDFEQTLTTAAGELPDDNPCKKLYTELKNRHIIQLAEGLTVVENGLTAVIAAKAKFKDLNTIIQSVLAEPSPFLEVYYPAGVGGATQISVELYKQNLWIKDAKEEKAGTVTITLYEHGRALSLTGGVGYSWMQEREFIRQTGLLPVVDAEGNHTGDTIGTIFGLENSSEGRPIPALLLTGHIAYYEPMDLSVGFSLGYILNAEKNDMQYLWGVTLGMLDERVLFSVGGHAARVKELSGGFKLGDPIPQSLPDEIPTQKSWKTTMMVLLTFRV